MNRSNPGEVRGPLTASSRALGRIAEQVRDVRDELAGHVEDEEKQAAKCELYINHLRSRHLWDEIAKWESARHSHKCRADGLRLALSVLNRRVDV